MFHAPSSFLCYVFGSKTFVRVSVLHVLSTPSTSRTHIHPMSTSTPIISHCAVTHYKTEMSLNFFTLNGHRTCSKDYGIPGMIYEFCPLYRLLTSLPVLELDGPPLLLLQLIMPAHST